MNSKSLLTTVLRNFQCAFRNNVHDVGGDHGLVVLAALQFHQAQELPDDKDQKLFLLLLACATHPQATRATAPLAGCAKEKA